MTPGDFRKSFGFALAGIAAAWRSEFNFRVHVACAVLLALVLVVLRPAALWVALCIVMAALVLAAELFNTAIESLCDHLAPEIHPAVKKTKDCAAAAVLVTSAGALIVGVMTVAAALDLLP